MKHYLIVDTLQVFAGSCFNTITVSPKHELNTFTENTDEMYVDYSDGLTFAQYKLKYPDKNLIVVDGTTYHEQYMQPFLLSLQDEFEEISEESFYDHFECLPPIKMKFYDKKNWFFFVGEAYYAEIARCCVAKNGKYYTALRSIHSDDEAIFNLGCVVSNAVGKY